jgi:uncharacterized membrane protein
MLISAELLRPGFSLPHVSLGVLMFLAIVSMMLRRRELSTFEKGVLVVALLILFISIAAYLI